MSEWITDRQPTAEDAVVNSVLVCTTDGLEIRGYGYVGNNPWMRLPDPYLPPVDTSMTATAERLRLFADNDVCEEYDSGRVAIADDLRRLLGTRPAASNLRAHDYCHVCRESWHRCQCKLETIQTYG